MSTISSAVFGSAVFGKVVFGKAIRRAVLVAMTARLEARR
jgi:hypothetical protein